jgi:hypothetical protein
LGLFNRLQGELDARERSPGLHLSDLLVLPEALAGVLNWMLRQGCVSLADLTATLGQDEAAAREVLATLIEKGFVREVEMRGETTYRVRLAPKRGRRMPDDLWRALEDKCEHDEEGGQ